MTEQAMMRYFFAIILVAGLVILCFTLSDRPWLVGIVLILVGVVVGGPLWWWHFDREAERQDTPRPEQPKKASEESPY